jgi:hypothetical protein
MADIVPKKDGQFTDRFGEISVDSTTYKGPVDVESAELPWLRCFIFPASAIEVSKFNKTF